MLENNVLLLFFAILGGVIPPLIWLFFWLHEDAHPEPKPMIVATFLGGVLIVPLAIILENIFTPQALFSLADQAYSVLQNVPFPFQTPESLMLFAALLPAVLIEEGLKFGAFFFIAYRNKNFDEPVDALVYLITAALGFAAFENILFFLSNSGAGDVLTTHNIFLSADLPRAFIVNNLRFIGANLLHIVASGFIGVAIGLSFYKTSMRKFWYIFIGFIAATLLHLFFNYFIIIFRESPVTVFVALWVLAILLILLFERVKEVRKKIFHLIILKKTTVISYEHQQEA